MIAGKKTRLLAVSVAALAFLAGCGNRVDHDAVVAVGNGYGPVDAQRDNANTGGAVVPDTDTAVVAPGAVAPGTAGPETLAPAGGPGGSTPGGGTGAPGGPSGNKPGPNPRTATGDARANAPCAQQLTPVVLGQTAVTSGLVGASSGGVRPGLAVWAKDINARGGLQCHPVQLIQLDDASDPARVAANWNTLVHERGAVAMLGAAVPIAIAALRSAAERDKVPVIGGDGVPIDWVQSPYLFPAGGAPLTSVDGGLVDAVKVAKGAPKAGLLYCVEAGICTSLKNNFAKSAERAGAALGPITAVSLTQPDFTSECQTMKAAGVNVLFMGADGSAAIRAVRSCASLNYFPTIATGATAVSAASASDAGLRRNLTFLGTSLVPYTVIDTSSMQAFHAAMKRYAPTTPEDQPTLLGWASGKLLEAALAKVSDKARAGNITTQMVLDGLWQLKNEKLGGLSPGATFTKGSPARAVDCYYGLRLDDKGFGATNSGRAVCFGADKKLESGAAAPASTQNSPAQSKTNAVQDLAAAGSSVTARQAWRGGRRSGPSKGD